MSGTPSHLPAPGIREQLRLAALDSYKIIDTAPEPEFDRFVQYAAARFGTPISLISLIDETRQWFKARVGLEIRHTPREIAFCMHTVATKKPLIVTDASKDERFTNNPFVTGEAHIRFYAGAPLITPLGRVLGTINVIDVKPRYLWSASNTEELVAIAREVMIVLERRRGALVRDRALREAPLAQCG